MNRSEIPQKVLQAFREGVVIPVLPCVMSNGRVLDESRQRALIRYYIDAGSGGLTVGIPPFGEKTKAADEGVASALRQLSSETIDRWCERKGRQILKLIEIGGSTKQALAEAESAYRQGYHACEVNLSGVAKLPEPELLAHFAALAEAMPLVGSYERDALGGRQLTRAFWRKFAEIENVIGIRIAPYGRFETLDVVRAVCETGREKEISLYTGNDENILVDLLTSYKIPTASGVKQVRIVGGILRLWSVWTQSATELLKRVHAFFRENRPLPVELLSVSVELTDAGSGILDAANAFKGRFAGVTEVLRRQGLLGENGCAGAPLSPGQAEEIARIYQSYPNLNDDDFVAENLQRWLAD